MTWQQEVANLVDIWKECGALTLDYPAAEMVKDIMAIARNHVVEIAAEPLNDQQRAKE